MEARRGFLVPALVLALGAPAAAGEIYGKIVEAGASVGDRATVQAQCGQKAYPPAKTDKSGSYHLVVEESGRCQLTIKLQERQASLDVVSYDEPVQIDVILETRDGKLAARRK
jgi:hypothetical protein